MFNSPISYLILRLDVLVSTQISTPNESVRLQSPPDPERFFWKEESTVPNYPSPIPNTWQKASLSMCQRRPDGLAPELGTVPVSGVLIEGLFKYGLVLI